MLFLLYFSLFFAIFFESFKEVFKGRQIRTFEKEYKIIEKTKGK